MSTTRARDRASLGAALRLSGTAAVTTWAAMLSWRGFTELASQFLFALIAVGAVIALSGALGRWRRLPGPVVFLGQVVAGSIVTCWYVGGRPWPDAAFWTAIDDAFSAAQTYAAPVPSIGDISVQPLLAIGGLAAMLLVDLLACTLRRVPLAGLPLLTVYSVPVSMLDGGLSWWVFVLTALGFLMMLFLQEQDHVGRWGRSLDPAQTSSHRSEAVRGSALLVGVLATAGAVVAPLVIPTFSLEVFDLGAGPGGNNQITIENPLTDLRRDLRRGPDIDLVEITTDDPTPDHLRISVLNRFSDNEFSSGDRDVPAANLANGPLPALQGVSEDVLAAATSYSYDVRIDEDFESRWLPTQAPVGAIDAAGDWRYDDATRDFLASQDDLTTAGMTYSMTALEYDFRADDLRVTPLPGDEVDDEVTALPDRLPSLVSQLARGVTAGSRTDYERAVALQQWFREDGGFRYSLEDAPAGEVGTDELEAFLRDDENGRVGYCEQFATAMAVMARVLDIPSRVAVGFLKPDRTDRPNTFVYSAHDLHAWPELYFPGAGWVLFDPTPSARVPGDRLPAYTTRGAETQLPTNQPSAEPTQAPSPRPTAEDPAVPTPAPEQEDTALDGTGSETSIPWLPILGVIALLLLIAVTVLAPRTLRERQRVRRLAGGPESAWEELRATTLDLGRSWPDARSPRETQVVLLSRLGRPGDDDQRPAHGPERAPDAVEALGRIVTGVERARYSAGTADAAGSWHDDVMTCRAALTAGATARARRRATWLPRSVTQRRPVVEAHQDADEDRSGELVEHM
ncbi:transglutaminaseTgpA domain-containing protein [Nocardioides sp.]|uniref:transglutaminaseTgpA domain-containing protein n=1 Tax=Nocardioides sp. TaxID=35761 RepID=UPI00262A2661|nr:transglutaminaseTgpA domain-containing protein [Nocardioides sp.]